MGLMDILNGMQNGPRGQQAPASRGGGGMSPTTMALLGLLAYKALKGGGLGNILGGQSAPVNPPPGGSGGGLGNVLGGMFGNNAQSQQGGLGSGAWRASGGRRCGRHPERGPSQSHRRHAAEWSRRRGAVLGRHRPQPVSPAERP